MPADSLLGQALSKQKESMSATPSSNASGATASPLPPKGTSWQDKAFEDDDAEMLPVPTLTEAEKKRKALSEAEESISRRIKIVGKQQPV